LESASEIKSFIELSKASDRVKSGGWSNRNVQDQFFNQKTFQILDKPFLAIYHYPIVITKKYMTTL